MREKVEAIVGKWEPPAGSPPILLSEREQSVSPAVLSSRESSPHHSEESVDGEGVEEPNAASNPPANSRGTSDLSVETRKY